MDRPGGERDPGTPVVTGGKVYVKSHGGGAGARPFRLRHDGKVGCKTQPARPTRTCSPLWRGVTGAATGGRRRWQTAGLRGSLDHKLYAFSGGNDQLLGYAEECLPLWTGRRREGSTRPRRFPAMSSTSRRTTSISMRTTPPEAHCSERRSSVSRSGPAVSAAAPDEPAVAGGVVYSPRATTSCTRSPRRARRSAREPRRSASPLWTAADRVGQFLAGRLGGVISISAPTRTSFGLLRRGQRRNAPGAPKVCQPLVDRPGGEVGVVAQRLERLVFVGSDAHGLTRSRPRVRRNVRVRPRCASLCGRVRRAARSSRSAASRAHRCTSGSGDGLVVRVHNSVVTTLDHDALPRSVEPICRRQPPRVRGGRATRVARAGEHGRGCGVPRRPGGRRRRVNVRTPADQGA